MKRKIIEALLPITMWLLEHWPRKRRSHVMVLPSLSFLERIELKLGQFSKALENRVEPRLESLRRYWSVMEDAWT